VTALARVPRDTKAWACLATNALLLPGLGSLLVGRILAGLLQALLSIVGFAMSTYWTLSWARQVLREGTLPEDLGPYLRQGLGGLLLFGAGWAWAVFTGIAEVRAARKGSTRA
jgi:hypothetical protein